MATVQRESIGLLNDKLTVKITKEDYLPAFTKKLKEYSKTANIPGFRKGMVPAGMIKKMYGPSIFSDEILRVVEKQLYTYLNEEKPEIFAQPLPLENDLRNVDMNNPSDFNFDFEIGLKPQFELPEWTKADIILYKVEVSDEMVSEEINRMLVKAGKMTEPESVSTNENVVNILFTEADAEGNAIENGVHKELPVLVKYLIPGLESQLMGKKVGDSIIYKLNQLFEGDKLDIFMQDLGYEKDDRLSAEKYFKLEIIKIGLVEKRELNEEFFNEVYPGKNITTEEELRTALKQEIEKYWGSQSRNQMHDQLYHYVINATKMDFPEIFLKRWMQTGEEKPKTAEEAEAEFPKFSDQLKWTMISDRLMKENSIEVGNEELRQHMSEEVMRYFGQMKMGEDMSWLDSYIDRMMKDEKQVDATYRRLLTEKLFTWVESQVTPQNKVVSPEELMEMQHNHQH